VRRTGGRQLLRSRDPFRSFLESDALDPAETGHAGDGRRGTGDGELRIAQ